MDEKNGKEAILIVKWLHLIYMHGICMKDLDLLSLVQYRVDFV